MCTAVPPSASVSGIAGRRPPAALTIGNFDGVHLGHQALIRRTCAVAVAVKAPTGGRLGKDSMNSRIFR